MYFTQILSFFGIQKSKLTKIPYLLSLIIVFILMILVSYKQTHNLDIHTDFAVFWHAGNNFKLGNDLYSNIGGADRFIYPPFAAWCFQIFAWVNLQQAGFFWCLLNFGLYAASIRAIFDIFTFYGIDAKKLKIAIFIAFVLSFRYFWYHQMYVQMNLIMFFLCLEGILAYLKKNENLAIFCFVLATFIKVLPLFFLFWIFVRGNYKTLLKMIGFSLFFVVIPILWRGFEQGIQDHFRYYAAFLEPFQNGRVEPKLNNYSLSAMIYKWCIPFQSANGTNFQLLPFSIEQAQSIYKASFIGLVFTYFVVLWRSRKHFPTPNYYEIVFIFCLMHLLSGISWEYHFVSLLFVFVPLGILVQDKTLSKMNKIIVFGLTFIAFLVGIDGQDTVGKTVHLIFNHYCTIAFLTLLLLFFNLTLLFRTKNTI